MNELPAEPVARKPPTATKTPALTPSTLCLACKAIFTGSSTQQRNESGEVEHHDLDALAARAARGCHLCLTVYMAIDPDAFKSFRHKAGSGSRGFAWISPIARDQARLKFRYIKGEGEGPERRSVPGSRSGESMGSQGSAEAAEGSLVVELMLMNPNYAVEPGVRTLDAKSVSTGSPESLEVARSWLEECSFNHMKCSVTEPNAIWKPTHLLDVTVKGPKGVQGVKLVDGMFLDPLSEFVTLSHCWGRGKAVRLTKKTLPSLRQGVAASSLPKTFADAATATEKLGFRYLWIDALCILHDNEQAVLHEISQMHKVYAEASLNLAAASSREDSAGLFCSRNVAALQPAVVEVEGQGIVDGTYKCLRSTIWHDLVDSAPLSKRAWVFQERCLAKRTLHFTRNEILWECQQMCCSEVFPKGLPASGTAAGSVTEVFNKRYHHQRTGNWPDLVRMYTNGRLTHSSDKLLAISGLARQYMSRNRLREQDYLAGLWKPQLPQALLWRVENGRGPTKYRAPSWSWASLDGPIMYAELAQSSKESCVEVIESKVGTKPVDALGQVESGSLKLRGFLVRGLLRRTHDYWGRTPCVIQCANKVQIELESASFDERLVKLSDVGGGLTEQLEVYLLPIIDTVDRTEGLILCATNARRKGEFRRIGAFDLSRYDQINWDRFKGCLKGDPNLTNYEERLDHTNGYWFASDFTYTISLV